ncbi:hypothetical protein [Xanthomonas sp. 1678]|uniref:hypothetical protein n=1 Tax=Xanthomonas sp. 1678 TaxID=3158788 RepID=UPI002864B025|nr:hypothetical protein [Xanthomonas translucens]
MKLVKLATVVITILVSGCANFHAPSSRKELKAGQSYWMSYDASRRGAIIVPEDSKIKTCAEPGPDVGMSFINTLKGDFKFPGETSATGVEAALKATAMALAGRDNVVLLAREALFRICEANINGAIPPSDVKALFQDVFKQVTEIAVAQANKAKSEADTEKSRVQQLQIMQSK